MESSMMMSVRMMMMFVCVSSIVWFHGYGSTINNIVHVSKEGNGDYTSVSEAIAQAPSMATQQYIIHVGSGSYEEYVHIPSDKTNIVLIGKGPDQTKIVGYDKGTTLDIDGNDFMAKDIGIVNLGGPSGGGGMATAVRNAANNSIFFQCSIQGFQDTLWAASGRQFYKNTVISGTVDFIFGGASALFQGCTLQARLRPYVTFTAQARESPAFSAFSFGHCKFTMAPEDAPRISQVNATLGRPWRAYSTVAIIFSYIDSMVGPRGWEEMPGVPTDKVTFVEFQNVGPGSDTQYRVKWPGVRRLRGLDEAHSFTASGLLDAASWIPSKGVPYDEL
ncbi:putative pectinesterase/pectinesterase inhibitor 22 [Senna tora]|uniref:Pectinesterase n=1 Tax=Senna tora TaxID=362788 RepID=A0A835CJ46_9FABA|nr:putative pectinesterase/pectinesterase inhibitor 22 [Senna tora]